MDENFGFEESKDALQRLYPRISHDSSHVTCQDLLDFFRQTKVCPVSLIQELISAIQLFQLISAALKTAGGLQLKDPVPYVVFERLLGSVGKQCFRGGEKSAWEQLIGYIRVSCFARYRVMLGSIAPDSRTKTRKKTPRTRPSNPYAKPSSTPRSTLSAVQSLNQKVSRLYNLVTPRNHAAPTLHHSFLPGSSSQRVLFHREESGAQTSRVPETLNPSLLSRLHSSLATFVTTFAQTQHSTRSHRKQHTALRSLLRSLTHSRHQVPSTQRLKLQLAVLKWRLQTSA